MWRPAEIKRSLTRLNPKKDQQWAPQQSQQDFPQGTLPPLGLPTPWIEAQSSLTAEKKRKCMRHEEVPIPMMDSIIWFLVTQKWTTFSFSSDRSKAVHLSHPSNPKWFQWVLRPQVCLTPSHGTWQHYQVKVNILTQNQLKSSKLELYLKLEKEIPYIHREIHWLISNSTEKSSQPKIQSPHGQVP